MFFISLLAICWHTQNVDSIACRYDYSILEIKSNSIYKWEQVIVTTNNNSVRKFCEMYQDLPSMGVSSSSLISLPVYVSLTAISSRMNIVNSTVISLLQGLVRPTQIFVFISRESYLLDTGVSFLPQELLSLAAANFVTIVYTNNIGPHRKLLPLLSRYWNEDCIIVNVDDDMGVVRNSTVLYQLLRYYLLSGGSSVVALRVRRFGICNSEPFEPTRYFTWMVYLSQTGRKEMLVLPTGTGGVLYRPRFFHSVVFDKRFRSLTGTADDLMFRLACMAKNVSVVIACMDLRYSSRQVRKCSTSMSFFDEFQRDHQKNQQMEVIEMIKNQSLLQSLSESLTREDLERDLHQETTFRRRLKDSNSGHKSSSKQKKSNHTEVNVNSNTSTSSLYDINRRRQNDVQWNFAQRYLKQKKVLDLHEIIRRHYHEREKHCYSSGKQRHNWECSLLPCKRSNSTAAAVKDSRTAA